MTRPPLPEGPYLVVGLARSGAAAMRMLAPHGEVIGVDSGAPAEARELPNAHLESDGLDLLDRAHTVVKSPGVPREAPVVAEALRRGLEVVYPPTDEPWGIRRFFVRDPSGSLISVLAHRSEE